MQTILGSGGSIGEILATELKTHTDKIRLVSRNPKQVNASDLLFATDLSKPENIDAAVKGSAIVYLTIGFEYKTSVWKEIWPVFMRNTIDACIHHNAKLVFFDNMYMYDSKSTPHMTEESPVNPSSEKGKVRAEIAQMILHEMQDGNLQAIIARAADFCGPKNSMLTEMVFKNLNKNKKAMWLASADRLHNFTYTPDAAAAMALLGNTETAYQQVWHLPANKDALTGRDWVKLFAEEMGKNTGVNVMPKWMIGLFGWFSPLFAEINEMTYQSTQDYFFDSSKFENAFNRPSKNSREMVAAFIQRFGNDL